MRFARRKLNVVKLMSDRIAHLEAKIKADAERFADMAKEYISLGDDCLQDEMPLPAIANYGKALTLSPTLIPALYGRAKAHTMLGETDKALDDYKTILDNDRADIRAVIEMASCYMAEGISTMPWTDACLLLICSTISNVRASCNADCTHALPTYSKRQATPRKQPATEL